MGVGSGWAGPLMLLLLLLACRASPTITSARRPRLLNLSRVARPPTSPAGLPVPLARGQMQYTLDLLASPASREGTDEHEDARLASQLTVEAQLLPWAVGVGAGGGMGCLEASVATRAAHLALQHHPPPAGVALLVLPPPPDFTCTERHGVEFLLTQMMSPSTRALIGGVEPGLCRVANHLARKYDKLFLSWSCLEIPSREVDRAPPPRTQTREEEEENEEKENENEEGGKAEEETSGENINNNNNSGRDSEAEAGDKDEEGRGSHLALVTPTSLQVARAMHAALAHLGWRHVTIVTLDWSYWRGVAHQLDVQLRAHNSLVAALAVLPPVPSQTNITHVFSSSATRYVKAYLLVVPAWSAVVGQIIRVAEIQGVTRHAAFLVCDPLFAPVPAPATPSEHTPGQPSRFEGLTQLTSVPVEAARGVMVLAAAGGGRGQDASHPHASTAAGVPQDGKLLTAGSGDRRRVVPASPPPPQTHHQPPAEVVVNKSMDYERSAVVTRLVYDSVSLLSHLLRANVGAVHLRRQPAGATNLTGEELRPRDGAKALRRRRAGGDGKMPRPRHPGSQRERGFFQGFPRLGTKSRRSRSPRGRGARAGGEPREEEEERERERLYFEMKTLDKAREDEEFERRLESIIGSRRISSPVGDASWVREGSRNRSRAVEMRIKQPTSFPGMQGRGAVAPSGERSFDFLLLDWLPSSGQLSVVLALQAAPPGVAKAGVDEDVFEVVTESEIDWAYDTLVPRDQDCGGGAICGYMAAAPLAPGYVVMIVLCLLFLMAACCGCAAVIRKRIRQKEMSRGPYKILLTSSDLTLSSRPDSAHRKVGDYVCIAGCVLSVLPGSAGPGDRPDLLRGSLSSPHRPSPHDSLLSTASHVINKEGEEAKAKYNGDFVHVKYFHVHAGGNFEVKNRTMTLLKQMRDLRHENINGFLGMLCDPIRPGLVMEYCSRKSLEDIIRQEDIKLDWSFRLSLLTDLVRGMRYLHGSLLRHHGRLTSRNCVIDARWVLKVTDYGLPGIYEYQNLNQPARPLRDLLWKAPELLRDESLMAKGTQAGDVFSLAIIMQEVVVRGAPYCMVQLSHQEIIARLKKPPPMIRPSVSKGAAPPDAINIMKQCWAELPEMRPDFNQINDLFKKLNQGRRQNIVDTMFHMLEKYSSNLEELIKDRTEQLDLEKKKTEQLLNRMLPSSVANQLKLGMPVAPEEFEEVTIYFSDIVGFTSISAYSTPFEVVDLLNDLYTAFDSTINHYNVYKVETIGDAYMVVGGAPKKIDDHASQIATMALDLLHLSGKFRIRHLHNIPLMLRIGIHTGPCCAGVVGMTMPRYCLFGDTVNTASRMESTGSAWRIHVSEKTWSVLRDVGGYHLEYRGLTKLKGKGEMNTYWLLGKEGFNKELPVPPEIGYSHGLDEELVRQGRQHYMNRRDSAVESLTTARGFSSIQAARLQSLADDAADGTSHSGCEGIAGALQEDGEACVGGGVGLERDQGEASCAGLPNGRALGGAAGAAGTGPEPFRSNKGKSSSSTKSASKSSCKNRNQSAVPKIPCGMGVQGVRRLSRDSSDNSPIGRPSSVPPLLENHVAHAPEGQGCESQRGSGLRSHPLEEGITSTPRCSTPTRSHPLQDDPEEAALRPSSLSRGSRREASRGTTAAPHSTSPPVLCHNKIFPQHGGTGSGMEDQSASWGHTPFPSFLPQPREGAGRGQQAGTTVECQVHPFLQDAPPSPTESTML
ncbi:uncharacterized protein LOC123515600 isoform X2 [Portunus trituberculatus]|uniref:uncharacterized protein LOC123515600 isoform X2 n=1 Tax=Portunus trituberculatus TaxID=210409 RepID=UPI001E1D08F9|nr:uncharacterized protein LOC123515600 isoform X2 [Portunus trituberculatus]